MSMLPPESDSNKRDIPEDRPCCDYLDHSGDRPACACPEHRQTELHPYGWVVGGKP